MRIALFQMTAGIDPAANATALIAAIADAAAGNATMLFTPEMSGMLDSNRERARKAITPEADDDVLAAVRAAAQAHRIWVVIGSMAFADDGDDGYSVNRSVVISAEGEVVARYDKIHLFDVDLANGERWRESSTYCPGENAVVVSTPLGSLGLAICYDVRFPALFTALTDHGATVLSIPAAFTVPTGRAHWHVLLRARAIENAAFVIAAAQTGQHEDGRVTYGHSLIVDPWGDVVLDMGTEPGVGFCNIDPAQVDAVRRRIPVIAHRRTFAIPAL